MGGWKIGFEYPAYLWLLLILLPGMWWIGQRSLSGLGIWRKYFALLFRSLVVSLVVFALAGVHWIWINDRVTVIYLLDQSDSIPAIKRELMLRYAIESTRAHRKDSRTDRAGLIIFGREATIEFPPLDENLPPISKPESYLGKTDATNLESALKLAQASFPENSARRIVIVTDGNETLGTAAPAAKRLADDGIGIDVVPIRLDSASEVLIEKIDIPGQVRQGQTVDARVVIQRYNEGGSNAPVNGKLRVIRREGSRSERIADGDVTLDRDVNVIPIPHRIDAAAGYTYEAEFIPDKPNSDSISQNNRATAYTYARGKGRVMFIENSDKIGEYDKLIDALTDNEIEVVRRDTSSLFSSLNELQGYDAVILAGVSRSVGEDAAKVESFSNEQIETLVRSVQLFGTGILMIGGPETFGAGGWANTKLEEAMPVDFQIKNAKIDAVGALAMVMHASELSQGNYWQKAIARSALDALGPMDYCGVVQYDMSGKNLWLWGDKTGLARVGENRSLMKTRLSRMMPGDMPDFDSSLKLALNGLVANPASMKHMIVISDGDPVPPTPQVLKGFVNANIKISTVAVGTHGPAGSQLLQNIAKTTSGNYYVASNPKVLPKIFMREARRVARPLIFEPEGGVQPKLTFQHESLTGIGDSIPTIKGFVLTQRKESPLVEVPLLSPQPVDDINATVLATWTYGLGRTAVLTTDAGKRWATEWTSWPKYDQFFTQLVRWTMRPTLEDGKYQIATQVRDGKVQVVVTATGKDDQLINFLEMSGTAAGPDLKPLSFALKQKAPGRYVGEFDASEAGAYTLTVIPGNSQAPLITGVTIPFSDEYRVRNTNNRLLEEISKLTPVGGRSGKLLPTLELDSLKEVVAVDTYRPDLQRARSLEDVWPLAILLGTALFFGDVLVRRVALNPLAPFVWLYTRLTQRDTTEGEQQRARLDRLRSTKADATTDIEKQRAATSFKVESDDDASGTNVASNVADFGNVQSKPSSLSSPPKTGSIGVENKEESYTARLLEAKRKAKNNSSKES